MLRDGEHAIITQGKDSARSGIVRGRRRAKIGVNLISPGPSEQSKTFLPAYQIRRTENGRTCHGTPKHANAK